MYLALKDRLESSLSGVTPLFSLALARSADHLIHCHCESLTTASTIIYLAVKTGRNSFQHIHTSTLALNWRGARAFVFTATVKSSLPYLEFI